MLLVNSRGKYVTTWLFRGIFSHDFTCGTVFEVFRSLKVSKMCELEAGERTVIWMEVVDDRWK